MLAERLTHTCTILRATNAANALGENEATYAANETLVPCLFMESSERVFASERGEWVQVPVTKLFFRPGADVQETDRFQDVAIDDGENISGVWYVESLLKRRRPGAGGHHVTAVVKRLP